MERQEAIEVVKKNFPHVSISGTQLESALRVLIPDLAESEDERIRKFLKDYAIEMIAGLESDISISVYDGVKGHDPDAEEELEKWREARAWLEKQKEQKPAEWNDTDNIGWDEAFACVTRAEKAAKNEEELQNAVTAEKWLKEIKFKYCVHPVKQEWSEEDEEIMDNIICILQKDVTYTTPTRPNSCTSSGNAFYTHQTEIDWLKSLRPQPHWKPSEEQMEALENSTALTEEQGEALYSLVQDLKKLM